MSSRRIAGTSPRPDHGAGEHDTARSGPVLLEHHFTCPYCWEEISMLLEIADGGQSYVEDCEVCCHPIHVVYEGAAEGLAHFEARRID